MPAVLQFLKESDRATLLLSIETKLASVGPSMGEAVLLFVEKLALQNLYALASCYGSYSNERSSQWAKQVLGSSPANILTLMGHVSASISVHSELGNGYGRLVASTATKLNQLLEKTENLTTPALQECTQSYLSALHAFINDRNQRSRTSHISMCKKELKELWEKYVIRELPVAEKMKLEIPNPDSLACFLIGVGQLAKTVSNTSTAEGARTHDWLLALLRLTLGETDPIKTLGAPGSFSDAFDIIIDELIWEVLSAEQELIKLPNRVFPVNYLDPFGSRLIDDDSINLSTRHSFFASRLALGLTFAIKFWNNNNLKDGDVPNWVFHKLWRNHVSNKDKFLKIVNTKYDYIKKKNKQELADLEVTPSDEVIEKVIYALNKNNCTSETYTASEWQRTCSHQGPFVTAAHDLIARENHIVSNDHVFIRRVFERLVTRSEFSSTALVALAAKLGVFHKGLQEPSCGYPQPLKKRRQSSHNSATDQIGVIENLVKSVTKIDNVESVPLAQMVKRIYYVEGDRAQLQPGFDWEFDGRSWEDCTSTQQKANESTPYLWLYGKQFLVVFLSTVDNVIRELKEEGLSSGPVGERLARFIFLVPWTKSKRLKDQPDSRELKLAVDGLGRSDHVGGWYIYNELTRPIIKTANVIDKNPFFSTSR